MMRWTHELEESTTFVMNGEQGCSLIEKRCYFILKVAPCKYNPDEWPGERAVRACILGLLSKNAQGPWLPVSVLV